MPSRARVGTCLLLGALAASALSACSVSERREARASPVAAGSLVSPAPSSVAPASLPAPSATGPSPGTATSPSQVPPEAVAAARIEELSRAYLGAPYRLDCLGEGSGPDPDPLFTRDCVDCQTLVEQVMAEAVAPWSGGLDAATRLIRYRGGEVSLENRHHYCVPDWLEHPWPVRDITASLHADGIESVTRRIDLPALLAARGGDAALAPAFAVDVTEQYVPRAQAAAVFPLIPDGSIVVFVHSRPDLVAGHLGFAFGKGEEVVLRHASQTQKRVVDEALENYLARAPRRFIGLKVLQPDVAGLAR
jgi:hypothetical protein